MKKSVYFSGIASANLMLFGSMFKVFHWPGAGILLVLATLMFCLWFLPSALIHNYQSQPEKKHKALHIVTFIVFFIVMLGVLFKVQHWPGAGLFLLIGIPLPFVLFLPVYLYSTRDERKVTNTNFLGIMFGLTFLAVFSVLLSLNISKNVLHQMAASVSQNEQSSFFLHSQKAIDNNVIDKKAEELYAFIDELKCELVNVAGIDCRSVKNVSINSSDQVAALNHSQAGNILFADGRAGKMDLLKSKLEDYRKAVLATEKISPELSELANTLFDTSDLRSDEEVITWEQREFSNRHLISMLDVLSGIQSNVLLVKSEL